MSDLHNQSFCTTVDLLARNMGLALSIAQRGPHPASNVKAAEKISTNFSRILEHVTDSYSQISETSTSLPFSFPLAQQPALKEDHEDDDDVIENAIARAMNIDSDDESEVKGGVKFQFNKAYESDESDTDESDVDLPSFGAESDDEDTTVNLDDMLPGQRANYLKTKSMSQGLREAAFHDTEETRYQKKALGITT